MFYVWRVSDVVDFDDFVWCINMYKGKGVDCFVIG